MAVFNINTDCLNNADYSSAEDIKKVKSYLYRLNDQLQYMFANLTVDDNYSSDAKDAYDTTVTTVTETAEQVTEIEQVVKGKASQASVKVLEDEITAEVTRASASESSLSSRISVNADNIALKVNSSDLGNSSLTIKPAKIELTTTGQLTIDAGNLTIDSSGNATFSGTLSAATGTFGSLDAIGEHILIRPADTGGLLGFTEGTIQLGYSEIGPGEQTITYGTYIKGTEIETPDILLSGFSSGYTSVVTRIEALEARVTALGG